MVRCKFKCTRIIKTLHWDNSGRHLYTAEFSVVTSGSEENKRFFEATPNGSLSVGTFSEDRFEVGKEYLIDLTATDAAAKA